MPTLELTPAHGRVLAYLCENPWWHAFKQLREQEAHALQPGDIAAAVPELVEEGYATHDLLCDAVNITPRGMDAAQAHRRAERAR